ncbi:MAG TPA: pyruvate:ferredoxin (flavodoxin) oxidoreductase [Candidatus Polarisedimenticolaceae bacterium]|nr:pyruvate:ferredoxin (flavodoxin) oxidoreductase [Candidatus Polarisedimenticolaceae bacterium]
MARTITVDAGEAVAAVAHRTHEVIAIYPITPSSAMGEHCDEWSARGRSNLWGTVPEVLEMQSEAGAAGAVHGALQAGALATTFTASQGLLLMIPNMYKIAGELTPFCMHVAARAVATHALSIFGDHSDVYACRPTGFALLGAGSVQEAQDFALISQSASLHSRIPFLHFFDGFRTSHEIAKIVALEDEQLRALLPDELIRAHRERGLSPERPVVRGTAQNPDTFFQAREAANPYYLACPQIVEQVFERFAAHTGRGYRLFDYVGHPQAERVLVLMGSGAETAQETVEWLAERGERVGAIKVRLFHPFSPRHFAAALPSTARAIAVLDRAKEPGAVGEPLYLEVLAALHELEADGVRPRPRHVVGGRYGLASKEFTPAMVKAALDELGRERPKNHFTLGIVDDVTHRSLEVDPEFDIEPDDVVRAVFYGLGSDGTVGANKNSIQIIGNETPLFAQGYFVYDSKKSGATTVSHLRFGPRPIRSAYLVGRAGFVGCHQFGLLDRLDVLDRAAPGAVLLLNAPPEGVWERLSHDAQQAIVAKRLRLYAVDAYRIAAEAGLGSRINTVMQACFFAISGVLPREQALAQIKAAVEKTYERQGREVVQRNFKVIDAALEQLVELPVPTAATAVRHRPAAVPAAAPDFVQRVTATLLAGRGDALPVSAFPVDGTWPSGTSRWEKRDIARSIPIWEPDLCIQCNKCAVICPHATIRAKVYEPGCLADAPDGFRSTSWKSNDFPGAAFSIQVAPEDCTGCGLCVAFCPAKDKSNPRRKAINMQPHDAHVERESAAYAFFLELPEADRTQVRIDVKGSQLLQPLFEYSGACAGCGETPYIKLLTQLFGDRALIANATGCSSIFGGNLPTTPYTADARGRGPAWSNSLFEDNAEFGLGFRLAVDAHRRQAEHELRELASGLGDGLADALLAPQEAGEAGLARRREQVAALRALLARIDSPQARRLERLADELVDRSIWLVGGDGWAYDIGYGGLDHVLAVGRKVNVLVLDTEVYSNTGGQQSKATPLGASAKFAIAGKSVPKKDLGMEAMSYRHAYVASVALGAKDAQTVRAFVEADSFPGPSLIIAYSHCIAHGYDLAQGAEQQRRAVASGVWPLYRFDPRRAEAGEPALQLDSGELKLPVAEYMRQETRFRAVEKLNPKRFEQLQAEAQRRAESRHELYRQLAGISVPTEAKGQ